MDHYQEGNEIYYNMVDVLDDSEVHQIYGEDIVDKNIDDDMEKLTMRTTDKQFHYLYSKIYELVEFAEFEIDSEDLK